MEFLRVPPDEEDVRRYVEELWVPYQRDYEEIVDGFALADDADLVDAEIDFRMERLDADDHELLVALDPADARDENRDVATADGDLVGLVETGIDDAPDVFDRPDRLLICELYVRADYRGDGLAQALVVRARERAREEGCPELALDVNVDNDRAIAFYEKLGFEPLRQRMVVGTDDLSLQ